MLINYILYIKIKKLLLKLWYTIDQNCIVFKSNKSFKMWGICHLFIIMLELLSFPFLNHVLEFLSFLKNGH